MNNFRKTLREKSTEELVNILQEVENDYGDDSLNAAREQTIKLIENILEERDVDPEEIRNEETVTAPSRETGSEDEKKETIEEEKSEEEVIEEETENSTEQEVDEVEEQQRKRRVSVKTSRKKSERKYKTLRFLASFIKISAILFFVLVIVGNVISQDSFFTSLIVVIVSLVVLIPYFALSELIYLFLDIEENTRITREILNRFYRGG